MVKQYERLLKLGTGITMGQERYGTAFHTSTATDSDDSLAAIIVDYAECTSAAKSKVKMGSGQQANMAMHMHNTPPPGYQTMPPPMYGMQQPAQSAAYFSP